MTRIIDNHDGDSREARLLRAVDSCCPGDSISVEQLPGGLTNANYKVVTTSGAYVLRLLAENDELLLIDRASELAANRAAAEIGLAPEVVAANLDEGVLVTRFLDGALISLEAMAMPATIERVAQAVRRVHTCPALQSELNPFRSTEHYEAIARQHGVCDAATLQWANDIAARIEAAVNYQCSTPCHGDLLNGNFIDDGALKILDWEYAGMGDPRQDLADISAFHQFGADQDRSLVSAYYGSFDEPAFHAIRVLRFMTYLRAGTWALMQQAISDLDQNFGEWATEQFEPMRQWGSSPEFEHHLLQLERHRR